MFLTITLQQEEEKEEEGCLPWIQGTERVNKQCIIKLMIPLIDPISSHIHIKFPLAQTVDDVVANE